MKNLEWLFWKKIQKENFYLLSEPAFLDIETANNHAENAKDLKTWISSIQVLFHGEYRLFRTPEELIKFYLELQKKYNLDRTHRLITYIHNSSYDLSYLVPYFEELDFEDESRGIQDAPNSFLTYTKGPFEFRCSFRLSGLSLENWSKDMHIEHPKKVGFYDYSKIIYQDTKLSENEQLYAKFDVLSMEESFKKQLEIYKDDLSSVPLTKTGYVRRELRNSCNSKNWKNIFKNSALGTEEYKACNFAYAGGYTHVNRFIKDKLICQKIGHRDFASHYPSQLRVRPYPIASKFTEYTQKIDSAEDLLNLYPKYSFLVLLEITEAKLYKEVTMPYIQLSKCLNLEAQEKLIDNGRVIYLKGHFYIWYTNLDFDILLRQYELSYRIVKVFYAKNMFLPREFIDVLDKFFREKTLYKKKMKKLESVFGELAPATIEAKVYLQAVKAMLNGLYGCCATNPLRNEFVFDENLNFRITKSFSNDEEISQGLKTFYKRRNNFLPYQIGVWNTAYARHELFEYIELIGYENCLYCDTDSIFYLKTNEIEEKIENLNKEKAKIFVEVEDKKIFYEQFEAETDGIAFKALHSKCYGIVNTDNELVLTVAGVPSRTIIGMDNDKPVYFTREEELAQGEKNPIKALDHLAEGFTFTINTGMSAAYVGAEGLGTDRKPKKIWVDGHEISTAGGCVLRPLETKLIHDTPYDPIREHDLIWDVMTPIPNQQFI